MPGPVVSGMSSRLFSVRSGAVSYRARGSDKDGRIGMTELVAGPRNDVACAGMHSVPTPSGNRNEPAQKEQLLDLSVKTDSSNGRRTLLARERAKWATRSP